MIYTDEENKRWWNGLTKEDQYRIFEKIIENGYPKVREWAEALVELWDRGSPLTGKNLASLRKWDN